MQRSRKSLEAERIFHNEISKEERKKKRLSLEKKPKLEMNDY
jgi:hypothetical protein